MKRESRSVDRVVFRAFMRCGGERLTECMNDRSTKHNYSSSNYRKDPVVRNSKRLMRSSRRARVGMWSDLIISTM